MKRNQIIAAMNALPEDCEVEFGIIPLDRQVEMMTFVANFLTLASKARGENYEPGQWHTALIDVFSRLGLGNGKEATYLVLKSAADFGNRVEEANGNAMQYLAKLAMQ